MNLKVQERHWVQRFDVAKLLESSLDMSYWKGEDHTKGVFFTDSYGYTLNKILAIRVKHDEQAPEVFYSFTAQSEDDSVITDYPFKEMEIKPKNHHLLFNDLKLKKESIDEIFNVSPVQTQIKIEISPISTLLKSVANKRERERSFLSFQVKEEEVAFEVVRKQKKERIVTFQDIVRCEKITAHDVLTAQRKPLDIEHLKQKTQPTNSEELIHRKIVKAVNAHTMFYTLKIFSSFNYALFSLSHDRIMITGDKQEAKEKKLPNIEVVISLTKNI